jgi:hypothetical protein
MPTHGQRLEILADRCPVPYLCQLCVETSVNDGDGGGNPIPGSLRNDKALAEFLVPQGFPRNAPFGIKNPVLCQLS